MPLLQPTWDNVAIDRVYSAEFFGGQVAGSLGSAEIVVPHVLSTFKIASVVDVGCGVGGWLQAFERQGVTDYLGIDGDHIPRPMLKIPVERFLAADLTAMPDLGRRFDLACSLEVAEHLPEQFASQFVAGLVRTAPIVLFSAATPWQGGTSHVNEQWPTYWAALFASHGYVAVDCVRPVIFENARIEWWYRQNILVFCQRDKCPAGYQPTTDGYELNRIHPGLVRHLLNPESGTEALAAIRGALPALGTAIARKLGFRRAR
jgi:SAM-dependent methyltransferase